MYRSRQERLHLKQIARLHSARSWGVRSKLGVEYKDLTKEERLCLGWKCTCERCHTGKQHKHLRKELALPFEGGDENHYRDIDALMDGDGWEGSVESWHQMLFDSSGGDLESVMYDCNPVLSQEDVDSYKEGILHLGGVYED